MFGGSKPIGASLSDALAYLGLDARDAHHEEFIKVIGGNGQKSHPFQRGMAGIDGFLEYPAVEMQPGKLTVNEPFRAMGDRRTSLGLWFFFFSCNSLCGFHEVSIYPERATGASSNRATPKVCYRDDLSMTLTFPQMVPSRRPYRW